MGRDLARAGAGQAVVLQLDTDIDISRGAVLAVPRTRAGGGAAASTRGWCGCRTSRFAAERGYLLRTATDLVPIAAHRHRAPISTSRRLSRAASLDLRRQRHRAGAHRARPPRRASTCLRISPRRGSFMLVDPITRRVGGGRRGGRPTHARETATRRRRIPSDARAARARRSAPTCRRVRRPRTSCAAAPTRWRS